MPTAVKNWILAIRPKTLPAAAGPVLMGFAMAFREGIHHIPSTILALVVALLIQAGTNMVNDYSDYKKGMDTANRVGPVRVTQAGLISPGQMKVGMGVVLALIILLSIPLVLRGGIPILVIGLMSVASGIFYTAGPFPLGYNGLGDIFVLMFFGPVAVAGTYYVQALEVGMVQVLAGLGPGLISVAILCVNNLRDLEEDRASGKRTLAVLMGRKFARAEYLISLAVASLIPLLLFCVGEPVNFSFLTILILPAVLKPVKAVFRGASGEEMNTILAKTGKILLLYSFLFSAGWQFMV